MANKADEIYPLPPESLKIERAPREELDRVQNARLKGLIRRSWDCVPFYRERWQKAGVGPNDIASSEDLRKLPVISKKDLEDDLIAISDAPCRGHGQPEAR